MNMQVNNVYKCDKCGKEYRSNDYGVYNKIVLTREFYERKEYDLCDRCIRYYRDVFLTSLRKYQRYCSAIQENAALWLNGGKT